MASHPTVIAHPPHFPPPVNVFTVNGTTGPPPPSFSSLSAALAWVAAHFSGPGTVTIEWRHLLSE